MGKQYIYFFLNNKDLVLNFKLKKRRKFKHILYDNDNDLQTLIDLKFKKAKDFSNFLYAFNLILKRGDNKNNKDLISGKKFVDNLIDDQIYHNFLKKLKSNGKVSQDSGIFVKNLMKLF